MTESSSEVEPDDDDGENDDRNIRHPRSPRPLRGGSNHDDDGNDGDMEESDAPPHGRRGGDPDADDSENARGDGEGGGRFYVDQDAYYRTEDGAVLKIRILSKPGSGGKYLVSLPDGATESVKPERLATLMELSSQELARLMKEKNRRRGEGGSSGNNSAANRDETDESGNEAQAPPSRHHRHRAHGGRRASRRGSDRRPTLDDGYMAGEDDGVGESSHESGRHGRQSAGSSKSDEKASKKKAAPDAGGDGTSPLLALSCPFVMVEAKKEEGGTKTVPLYDKGIDVYYKNFAGIQPAHILSNHLDDLLDPYYSIRLEDGREKQTDNAHIRLTALEFETKEANLDDKVGEAGEGAIVPVVHKKRGSDASSASTDAPSSNRDASLTEYKKQYEALAMDGSDRSDAVKGLDTTSSTLASSAAASNSNDLTPAPSTALAPAHKFAVGDDVLYCSSQGESSTVSVTRLNLDKKGRPYYVVRLPGGKEKQVYGHRLKPLRIEPEAAEEKSSSRSHRRSRSRSAAPSGSRGRSRSLASGLRRSAVKRSDSVSSRTSNGSSQVSGNTRGRKESARDPEPSSSVTSDSRGGTRMRSSSRARGRSRSVAASTGRASRSRSTAGRRERSTSRPPEEGAGGGGERRPRAKRGAVGVSSSSRKVAEGGDGGGGSRLSSIRKSFAGMSRSKH